MQAVGLVGWMDRVADAPRAVQLVSDSVEDMNAGEGERGEWRNTLCRVMQFPAVSEEEDGSRLRRMAVTGSERQGRRM